MRAGVVSPLAERVTQHLFRQHDNLTQSERDDMEEMAEDARSLEAERDRLAGDRDEALRQAALDREQCDAMTSEAGRLAIENRRLAALDQYAEHHGGCPRSVESTQRGDCTCGLDAARAAGG